MGMQLIETIEVGSGGATSIEFTSIPQDGVDVLCLFSLRSNATSQRDLRIYINGLTSGYSDQSLYGSGSSVSSMSNGGGGGYWFLNDVMPASGMTADTFGNAALYLFNYTGSAAKAAYCNIVEETAAAAAGQLIWSGAHTTTNAITSLKLQASVGNLVQYSTAHIYKITAD